MATDLENFLATTEHRAPEHILFGACYTPDLHRRLVEHIGADDIAGHYGYVNTPTIGVRKPDGLPEFDYSKYWEGEELPEGTTFAGGVAMVPSGFYHFWGYVSPLRKATSLKDIEEYPLQDLTKWEDAHLAGEVREAHDKGLHVAARGGDMYEPAWQIRGYEQFLMDMIERPAWAECLLGRIADQNMIRGCSAARAGADVILFGDDVANQNALMFSKPMWRKFIHSHWRKIWAEVKRINPHSRIWYHSDGNIADIVDDLVEAGLDILNPLQPECLDVDAIHRRHGRRLTFDGTIGTQSTMPFGSPDEVKARVKEVIDKYGRNGGLIIAPTHVLEPDVPLENIDAYFEACREYGKLS